MSFDAAMGRQSIETLLAQMYNNEVEVSLGGGRWVQGVKGNDEGVLVGFVSFTGEGEISWDTKLSGGALNERRKGRGT